MTKFALAAAVLVASTTSLADQGALKVAIKGSIQPVSQIGIFQEVLVDGKIIAQSDLLPKKETKRFVKDGFTAVSRIPLLKSASNCAEAIIVVEVGEGNVLPNSDGTEVYRMPEISTVSCINKTKN